MKEVSSAKLRTNPTGVKSDTEAARANQVENARPRRVQSTAFPRAEPRLRCETMSSAESPRIATPYQSGKNPAPGPSAPRYSHCRAWMTMYAPSAASATPDHRSPDLRVPSSMLLLPNGCGYFFADFL